MSKTERTTINFEDILAREGKSNVLFFNYDNEAFMNTGIQESGGTPGRADNGRQRAGSGNDVLVHGAGRHVIRGSVGSAPVCAAQAGFLVVAKWNQK